VTCKCRFRVVQREKTVRVRWRQRSLPVAMRSVTTNEKRHSTSCSPLEPLPLSLERLTKLKRSLLQTNSRTASKCDGMHERKATYALRARMCPSWDYSSESRAQQQAFLAAMHATFRSATFGAIDHRVHTQPHDTKRRNNWYVLTRRA
jgi:hypothetical protein